MMYFDWTAIGTCASAVIALVALIFSCYQIYLSNKQNLFNRRISIWSTTNELAELYSSNQTQLQKENDSQHALGLVFLWLTNNSYLCDIGLAATHPLETEYQKPFLLKLGEIKNAAFEAKYAFKGKSAEIISRFLLSYRQLLFAIYQYQVLMDNVSKTSKELKLPLEQACEELKEPEQRKKLYLAYDEISEAYTQLVDKKTVKSIEKQLRLHFRFGG